MDDDLKTILKYVVLAIIAILIFAFGYTQGRLSVFEHYSIDCKVGTSTECYFKKD